MAKRTLTPTEIRRISLTAIASDDVLVEHLVLKGGNALALVHGLAQRASFDLDFSIEGDFDNPEEMGQRLQRALADRFDAAAYVVFDYDFRRVPAKSRSDEPEKWGGYQAKFKLLAREDWNRLGDNLEKKRFTAITTGEFQQRSYTIDISKYEYVTGKEPATVDEYQCYVYTLAMIATEKIRAICQQSPEYSLRGHPAPRPRDFYDIHAIVTKRKLDLATSANIELLRRMFDAKEVPFGLLTRIEERREFHRGNWESVEQTVTGPLEPFDHYFDFVVSLANRLHALGIEKAPLA